MKYYFLLSKATLYVRRRSRFIGDFKGQIYVIMRIKKNLAENLTDLPQQFILYIG